MECVHTGQLEPMHVRGGPQSAGAISVVWKSLNEIRRETGSERGIGVREGEKSMYIGKEWWQR